jgi:hypothetical protein
MNSGQKNEMPLLSSLQKIEYFFPVLMTILTITGVI